MCFLQHEKYLPYPVAHNGNFNKAEVFKFTNTPGERTTFMYSEPPAD